MKLLQLSDIFKRTALQIMLFSFITFLSVSATYAAPPKKYAEIKNDQALVYFIRPSISDSSSTWLYADDQFLTYVKDKTYSFAYVKPGKHLIWLTFDWRITGYELEFVPGQVYYIKTGYELSFLNETAGNTLIKKMKRFIAAEDVQSERALNNGKTNYPKALAKEDQKNKAFLPSISEPKTPDSQVTPIKINCYTPIKLKFCETVTSAKNHTGDPIRLEVTEDVYCNQQLCFHKGTPVKAIISWSKPNGFLWKQGLLNITITAVSAVDGTEIPTVGQLLLTGGSPGFGKQLLSCFITEPIGGCLYKGITDKEPTFTTFLISGLIGGAFLKGNSATIPSGQEITVWTRADNWIKPVKPAQL